jgi:DNA-binding CsgD family transcriptional regulator
MRSTVCCLSRDCPVRAVPAQCVRASVRFRPSRRLRFIAAHAGRRRRGLAADYHRGAWVGGPVVALPHDRGGFGYLLKDRVLDLAEFLDAADRVSGGGSALDPKVVASHVGGETDSLEALTARDREVLSLMAEGLTNNAIARRLVLTERTVERHVRSVLIKLDLPSNDDAHRRVLAVIAYLRAAESHH